MGFLTDWLTDWIKRLLIEGIMGNLTGLFDTVNTRVGEIAVQVGTTPAAWNAGVFSLIRQLSETVILPIAGLILTFVATYELIQLIIEKNNLHDLDYWIFFKWIFKTACAILVLSNTFNIVNAVFDNNAAAFKTNVFRVKVKCTHVETAFCEIFDDRWLITYYKDFFISIFCFYIIADFYAAHFWSFVAAVYHSVTDAH